MKFKYGFVVTIEFEFDFLTTYFHLTHLSLLLDDFPGPVDLLKEDDLDSSRRTNHLKDFSHGPRCQEFSLLDDADSSAAVLKFGQDVG